MRKLLMRGDDKPNGVRLLIGQALLSRVASSAELVALNWWVFHATGSSTLVGLITFARLFPLILAAPKLGAMSDKKDPTQLLAFVLFIGSAATLLIAGLILVAARTSVLSTGHIVWLVCGVVAIRALITSAEPAIRNVVLTKLSEDTTFMSNMSSLSLVLTLSLAIGPAVSGLFMAIGGVALAIALSAVLYGIAAVIAIKMSAWGTNRKHSSDVAVKDIAVDEESGKQASPQKNTKTLAIIRAEIRKQPALGAQLILAAGPMLFVFPYTAMLPVIAHSAFTDDAEYGVALMAGAAGIGAVLGALVIKRWIKKPAAIVAFYSAVLLSIPLAGLATSLSTGNIAWLNLLLIGSIGLIGQLYRTTNRVATLVLAPDVHRGLFSGISQTDRALIPCGAFFLGIIADHASATVMISCMVAGNILFVLPALGLMMRSRRVG
ncbi:MFS transporter [Corynebacterium silvaticum]|uniref:MFS transporter n=1 Tax=Corynebacterium silvaticum TaxID=2320431 RepID=A0A7Y4PAC6_9CORY|nr:MFS transporter [Corynebacterium silvaticum]ARU47107.1 MFS transporter [Corynebacterium silvaticum]NON71146.1 MFS transporter [Corynebacterium silvaticum]UWH01215.1 MFS transporter [Corynebacterium silvaticum]UWH03262.1 MFS transporter [Corynebacterium silvaticum]UWH05298.1 MFS transporter [Corynebacterium silvaticum]